MYEAPFMLSLAVQNEKEILTPDQILANEIVIEAAIDYINELLKDSPDPYKIRKSEEFFNGKWYEVLTNVDGHVLMMLCRRNAEECKQRGIKKYRRYIKEKVGYEQTMV